LRPTIYAISGDLVIIERSTSFKNLNHSEAVLIDAFRSMAKLTLQTKYFLQILPSN
jgi:hypothetical protein